MSPLGHAAASPTSILGGDYCLPRARPPSGRTPNQVPPVLEQIHSRPLGTLCRSDKFLSLLGKSTQVKQASAFPSGSSVQEVRFFFIVHSRAGPTVQLGMGFYSTFFVVPTEDGGLRPILT